MFGGRPCLWHDHTLLHLHGTGATRAQPSTVDELGPPVVGGHPVAEQGSPQARAARHTELTAAVADAALWLMTAGRWGGGRLGLRVMLRGGGCLLAQWTILIACGGGTTA